MKRKRGNALSDAEEETRNAAKMPAILDREMSTPGGNKYIVKSDHRATPTEHKSAWNISIAEEVSCFDKVIAAGWTRHTDGWGLHLADLEPLILGRNLIRELKIGKFVSDPPENLWHGYPADYRTNQQDRPPVEILTAWRDEGIIKKHEVARVRRGQPCSLSD